MSTCRDMKRWAYYSLPKFTHGKASLIGYLDRHLDEYVQCISIHYR